MPRKPKNKSGDQEQNTSSRTSEEGSISTGRSASMGDDVEETTYGQESTVEEDAAEDIDVTDDEDEDEDESAPRRS